MKRRVPLMLRIATWVPYFWLGLFFAVPFLIVLKVSLSQSAIAIPPYTPVFEGFNQLGQKLSEFSFDNYIWLTEDALYRKAYVSSLVVALVSTVITILVDKLPNGWRSTDN